jgi:hypothetical protein
MKNYPRTSVGLGLAILAGLALPRETMATLLDTNWMLTTVSILSASSPVGARDAENTIHLSTGVISSFGPEVKDYDFNPATELHHIGRTTFVNGAAVADETMFLKSGATGLFVEYDLGAEWPLSAMYVWNYGEPFFGEPRGVKDLEVSYKLNLADPWTVLGTNTLAMATYPPAMEVWQNNVTVISGFPLTDIRYVRLYGINNYGDTGFIGLSEVVFLIPEPSTALLFVTGGGLLWRWRRRQRSCGVME